MEENQGFLSRWSRRKVEARHGDPLPDVSPPEATRPLDEAPAHGEAARARAALSSGSCDAGQPDSKGPPPPTLADVAMLTRESDYARFVAPEVSGEVRNAALKKLFTDPHFNVMDGLDTYIDDYNTPDPLPASMLRQMAQAAYLGLVEPEPAPTSAPMAGNAPAVPTAAALHAAEMKTHDEDPDLRLQPLDDAGPPGAEPGADEDTGRQR
ncbi:DUF3306 domain-containing protein [Hydrogenophaga sp. 2FB]|uniref:DUF3306 domain-containing protein n=1 Tax=Hydrogenophaga sp. 2FB TaxID=2502187 RepID=UPI0010F8052B|nr:DUF3306 domain-containing protein [Hydrogenophaga sp. 2FB]